MLNKTPSRVVTGQSMQAVHVNLSKLQACTASVCALLGTEIEDKSMIIESVWTSVHRASKILRDNRLAQVHPAVSASLREIACESCRVAQSGQHGSLLKHVVAALMAVLRASEAPLFIMPDAQHILANLGPEASGVPDKNITSCVAKRKCPQISCHLYCALPKLSVHTRTAALPRSTFILTLK